MNNIQKSTTDLNNKISRINALKKEIYDLGYFTDHISSRECSHRYSGFILKIRRMVSLRIFGAFYFGCGSHQQEINIPVSLHGYIHQIAVRELRAKEEELSNLIN